MFSLITLELGAPFRSRSQNSALGASFDSSSALALSPEAAPDPLADPPVSSPPSLQAAPPSARSAVNMRIAERRSIGGVLSGASGSTLGRWGMDGGSRRGGTGRGPAPCPAG